MIRRFAVLSLSALALAMVAAAPASAATPELRGVVSGSPYGASQGYIAVPVLYSKMTARRVGLKSPVGLMVVKRTERIRVNGGPSTLPVGLRVGDRFKGNAEVSSLNKRIFYPRITFAEPPSVYFRSKELSLSELTRMIQAVEKNLTALGKFTFDGFNLTAAQVAGLQKQLDELKKLIAGLPKVDLGPLQAQIDALNKQVADLLASLANYALKSDLAGLLNSAGVQALIDAALDGLDIPTEADINALIAAALAGLDIPTDADINGLITAALNGLTIPDADDINALIDTAIADLVSTTDLTTALNGLVTTTQLTTALNGLVTTTQLNDAIDDLVSTTDLNTALNGLVTTTQLTTALNGLVTTTQLNNAVSGLASQADLDAAEAQITQLTSDLNAAEAQIQTVCTAVKDAEVTLDPDGAGGLLSPVTVPVTLGNAVGSVCP